MLKERLGFERGFKPVLNQLSTSLCKMGWFGFLMN